MPTVFEKLNLKHQEEILVVNAPPSFEPQIAGLKQVKVRRQPGVAQAVQFALVFVTELAEVESFARLLAPKAQGDAILWFAYPKGTSKRYACEFNRDRGWESVRAQGFDTVRQIAIDEDWSALRFRRREYIK